MFELIIILCRYLFLFYIVYFLYQSVMFGRTRHASLKQRVCIILFILTAYGIISYNLYLNPYAGNIYGTVTYLDGLKTGVAALLFFIFAFISSGIIYKDSDPYVWNSVFFLMSIGLVTLQRLNPNLAAKQLVWFCIGYLALLFIPIILNLFNNLYMLWPVFLILGLFLLASPFFLGSEHGGAVNWIIIKGVSFQPSELVKFFFVFFLASVFRKELTLRQLVFPVIAGAAFVICLVLQTDLGGALIFFMTFMIMLYISTSNEYLLFLGLGFAGAASYLAYNFFRHVRTRVAAWQNPWADQAGGGYQIIQSLYAIGTWGFMGSGLTRGMPGRIPVIERDFIFSAICEEFGALFGICVILIFVVILYRGARISIDASDRFWGLIAMGFTTMLSFQAFLIIGGCIKLIPLTGVTLPFISYGGSSITVSLFMIGILQWIKIGTDSPNP